MSLLNATITRNEVQQHVNLLGRNCGHHTANRAYDDLRAVYSWGTKYGYVSGANPCTNITKFKTRARERFIRPDEFENFLEALRGENNIPFRDYVYLSLFTGARRRTRFQCDGIRSISLLVSGTFRSLRIRNRKLYR